MNPGYPYNITDRRQRNRDREEELEDIDLGNREYQFEKGKETMADDDKIAFNSLISAIKELTTGQKEMMSTFRQMIEKNGPIPHSPLFPNSDRVSTCNSREHLHTNMQSHPHIYKPFRPTTPQFLDSPAVVPLAQAEPAEPMSAYLREYRDLGEEFHSSMTFIDFFHFKIKNKRKAYNRPFT